MNFSQLCIAIANQCHFTQISGGQAVDGNSGAFMRCHLYHVQGHTA